MRASPVPPAGRTPPTLAQVGDSVDRGYGGPPDRGWLVPAVADRCAYVRLANPGERASRFVGNHSQARRRVAALASRIVCGYGVNDLSRGATLAELQGDLTDLWSFYAAQGKEVW